MRARGPSRRSRPPLAAVGCESFNSCGSRHKLNSCGAQAPVALQGQGGKPLAPAGRLLPLSLGSPALGLGQHVGSFSCSSQAAAKSSTVVPDGSECSSPSGPRWRPCSASSALPFTAFTSSSTLLVSASQMCTRTVWRACDDTGYCALFLELLSPAGRAGAKHLTSSPPPNKLQVIACCWPRDHATLLFTGVEEPRHHSKLLFSMKTACS